MRALFFAAFAALFLTPSGADAASGPGGTAPSSWDRMQKLEYYIGRASGALDLCGNYSLSAELKKLADLSPYGRKGWRSMQSFDGINGAQCGKVADDAKEILGDRDQLVAYLTEKYDCPGGDCGQEKGNTSLTAACRTETDEHLASLPLNFADIKSVSMITRNVEAGNMFTGGKVGHEAWVRLKSCPGWLVIDLSKHCTPRQSYTRGDCDIEGIKGY